jgi:hypothetical protein
MAYSMVHRIGSVGWAWIGLAWFAGILWLGDRFRIPHPSPVWPVLALGVITAAQLAAAHRVLRPGPASSRRRAIGRLALALLPTALILSFIAYLLRATDQRQLPFHLPIRMGAVLGSSLGQLEVRARCSNTTTDSASGRIRCFHPGLPRVTDQVEAMDAHRTQMEHVLGAASSAPAYWARCSMWGRQNFSFEGWAMSDPNPADDERGQLAAVDLHEMAHCVINMHLPLGHLPPGVLIEGWAMAMQGEPAELRHAEARQALQQWGAPTLTELLTTDWYRTDDHYVYSLGGSLALYLLERFDGPTFLELYRRSASGQMPEVWQEILLEPIESTERAWHAAIGADPALTQSRQRQRLNSWELAPACDAALWQRVVDGVTNSFHLPPSSAITDLSAKLTSASQFANVAEGAISGEEFDRLEWEIGDGMWWRHERGAPSSTNFEQAIRLTPQSAVQLTREHGADFFQSSWQPPESPRSLHRARLMNLLQRDFAPPLTGLTAEHPWESPHEMVPQGPQPRVRVERLTESPDGVIEVEFVRLGPNSFLPSAIGRTRVRLDGRNNWRVIELANAEEHYDPAANVSVLDGWNVQRFTYAPARNATEEMLAANGIALQQKALFEPAAGATPTASASNTTRLLAEPRLPTAPPPWTIDDFPMHWTSRVGWWWTRRWELVGLAVSGLLAVVGLVGHVGGTRAG